jgi:hypothetical protein
MQMKLLTTCGRKWRMQLALKQAQPTSVKHCSATFLKGGCGNRPSSAFTIWLSKM